MEESTPSTPPLGKEGRNTQQVNASLVLGVLAAGLLIIVESGPSIFGLVGLGFWLFPWIFLFAILAIATGTRALYRSDCNREITAIGMLAGLLSLLIPIAPLFLHQRMVKQSLPRCNVTPSSAPDLILQPGFSSYVGTIAVSPDGKTLAIGSSDNLVTLWDTETGVWQRSLLGHSDIITSITFSEDGAWLASGSRDQTIKIWDVNTGELKGTLSGNKASVQKIAFCADDNAVQAWVGAAWESSNLVRWNPERHEVNLNLSVSRQPLEPGHSAWVNSLALSPDGKLGVSGSWDKTVKLWTVSTGTVIHTWKIHTDQVLSVAFSPDGKTIASASRDGRVHLLDVRTKALIRTLSAPANTTTFEPMVIFSHDGRKLAIAGWGDTVQICDAYSGKSLISYTNQNGWVRSLAFSPNGKRLAVGGYSVVVILDTVTGQPLLKLPNLGPEVKGLAFSPDGTLLAAGGVGTQVTLFDVKTGVGKQILKSTRGLLHSLSFSRDGQRIAGGFGKSGSLRTENGVSSGTEALGEIAIWKVRTGSLVRVISGEAGPITSVAFYRDGRKLVSASGGDSAIKLWDLQTGEAQWSLVGLTPQNHPPSTTVLAIAFSPDGRILARGCKEGKVFLSDTITGALLRIMTMNQTAVKSLAFSPDGRFLATGGSDGRLVLFDVKTGRPIQRLAGHSGRLHAIAFSSDGKTLATGSGLSGQRVEAGSGNRVSGDEAIGEIKLWDWRTGSLKQTLTPHVGAVNSLCFSSNSNTLYSASSGDRTVKVWKEWFVSPVLTVMGATFYSMEFIGFSPDGSFLATRDRCSLPGGKWEAKLWDFRSGALISRWPTESSSLVFSSEGNTLVESPVKTPARGSSPDGKIQAKAVYQVLVGGFGLADYGPIGQIVHIEVQLWDVASKKLLHRLRGYRGAVGVLVFSPDGKILAAGGDDHCLRLWNTKTGQLKRSFSTGPLLSASFSADGKTLAVNDGKIWDVETGALKTTVPLTYGESHVALSPDGKTLAALDGFRNRVSVFYLK